MKRGSIAKQSHQESQKKKDHLSGLRNNIDDGKWLYKPRKEIPSHLNLAQEEASDVVFPQNLIDKYHYKWPPIDSPVITCNHLLV